MPELLHTTARHLDLAYRAAGHGPTLVLLHAFPLNQEMWAGQIEALRDHAHVITLDLPGFGASQTADGDFSIETLAEIVHDFVRHLGHERIILGGLSMGGYIALAYARKYPSHLQGLILADTKATPDTDAAREARMQQRAEIEARGLRSLSQGFPQRILTSATKLDQPGLSATLGNWIAGNNAMAVSGALAAMADRPDTTDVLPGVHVPALVLVGEADDVTTPQDAQAMVDHLPKGKLVHISGAGHLSNLENPDAFNQAVIEFLGQFKN